MRLDLKYSNKSSFIANSRKGKLNLFMTQFLVSFPGTNLVNVTIEITRSQTLRNTVKYSLIMKYIVYIAQYFVQLLSNVTVLQNCHV